MNGTRDHEKTVQGGDSRRSEEPVTPVTPDTSAGFGASNPSPLRHPKDSTRHPKPEELGQNVVGREVAAELSSSWAWDEVERSWYHRSERGAIWSPVNERRVRVAVSDLIAERYRPDHSHGWLRGVVDFMRDRMALDAWTDVRHLLPMRNGVLDLRSGELRDHDAEPDWRWRWQLPYRFEPGADCPEIHALLEQMADGDGALLRLLYAWLHCVLTGRHELQKFVELIGPGGTGKSTFLRLATLLVGEGNTASTDLRSLEGNRFEAASLYGRRLALIADAEKHGGEVATLKSLTGGDPIRLEKKHQQQTLPFVFTGLVMIAANQPMASSDYTSGLSRRRLPLSFSRRVTATDRAHYADRDRYPDGIDTMFREQMPGLVNHLLAMSPDDAARTVTCAEEGVEAHRLEIELETNPLLAWADEYLAVCAVGEPETGIGKADGERDDGLYPSYVHYCQGAGRRPVSQTAFSRSLVDQLQTRGVETERKRRNTGACLVGLRLRRPSDGTSGLLMPVASRRSAIGDGVSDESMTTETAPVTGVKGVPGRREVRYGEHRK